MVFFDFLKNFVMLVFLGNNPKMKSNILTDISPSYLAQFRVSSYGPKCCQLIILQDSLKCSTSRKKWIMKFIFLHADKNWSLLPVMFLVTCFWVVVVKNGRDLFNHGTLKSAVSQEWIDEMSWFFACCYMLKVKC